MRVVGLDLSLTGTAWAAPDGTGRFTNSRTGIARLRWIRDGVLDVCSGSELIVLEGYSYASANQAHQVGELGGVIRVALDEADLTWVVCTPQNRAKFATGKGSSAKDQVVSVVSARVGRAFDNNDEVDAFVLRQMGLVAYGAAAAELSPTNEGQREALRSVDWPLTVAGVPRLVEPAPKKPKKKRKAAA